MSWSDVTFTYNPQDIGKKTVSGVRFALGDVDVEGAERTCMLSDQEIEAILEAEPHWKKALFLLADAVCMRLSYETDWSDDGASFKLGARADRWKKIRDGLKAEADAAGCVPASGAVKDALHSPDGGHYFTRGMNNSSYVVPPYFPKENS